MSDTGVLKIDLNAMRAKLAEGLVRRGISPPEAARLAQSATVKRTSGATIAVKSVGKGIAKVGKAIATIDPVTNTLVRVARGERIDRAVGGAIADQRKIAKVAAPVLRVVSTGASFVPGIGTTVAMATRGAAAWGEGKNLAEAALEAGQGALPGGELTSRAITLGGRIARGERVDRALLATGIEAAGRYGGALGEAAARSAVAIAQGDRVVDVARRAGTTLVDRYAGPVATVGAQTALRLARGERVLDVARDAVAPVARQVITTQGQAMNDFVTARLGSIAPRSMRRPLISSPMAALPSPFGQRGTLLAATLRATPALGGLSNDAISRRTGLSSSAVSMIRRGASGLTWRGLSPKATRLVSARSLAPLRTLTRDTGALSPDGRSYTVEKGDTGSKIAQKLTGNPNRWPELKAANPVIAARKDPPAGYTQKFGMVLWGGEVLALPDSWIKPAGPEATTASVIQAQGILATWGKTDGAAVSTLTDYGTHPEDIDGSWDARDRLMLVSFSNWRGKGLATDGHLTDQHLGELRAWAEEKARQVLPIPAALPAVVTPAPAPTAAPEPSSSAPASMPPDFTIPQQQASVPTARFPDLPAVPVPPALPAPVAAPGAAPVLALPPAAAVPIGAPPVAATPAAATPAPTGAPGNAKPDGGGLLLALAAAGAYAFGLI